MPRVKPFSRLSRPLPAPMKRYHRLLCPLPDWFEGVIQGNENAAPHEKCGQRAKDGSVGDVVEPFVVAVGVEHAQGDDDVFLDEAEVTVAGGDERAGQFPYPRFGLRLLLNGVEEGDDQHGRDHKHEHNSPPLAPQQGPGHQRHIATKGQQNQWHPPPGKIDVETQRQPETGEGVSSER